jgi:hypothetical protein
MVNLTPALALSLSGLLLSLAACQPSQPTQSSQLRPAATASRAVTSKQVASGRVGSTGAVLATETVKVSLPAQTSETNVTLNQIPAKELAQEFEDESPLTDAFEIRSEGAPIKTQNTTVQVEMSLDLATIPEDQRNTANTYALVWDGTEWTPVFGAVNTTKGKLSVHLRQMPDQDNLRVIPVTSKKYALVTSDEFSTQQFNSDEGRVSGGKFMVIYTTSSVAIKERQAELERVANQNTAGKDFYSWCTNQCGGEKAGTTKCVSRDFQAVSPADATKIAQYAQEAWDFYKKKGFESLDLNTDESGHYNIIFANGWSGGALRNDGQTLHDIYGLYRDQNFALYLGGYNIADLKDEVAHELFHAVQHSYYRSTAFQFPVGEYYPYPSRWITEGTAGAMAGWFVHGKPHTQEKRLRDEGASKYWPFPIMMPFSFSDGSKFDVAYQAEQFWVTSQREYGEDIILKVFQQATKNAQKSGAAVVNEVFNLPEAYRKFIDYLDQQKMLGKYTEKSFEPYRANQEFTIPPLSSAIYRLKLLSIEALFTPNEKAIQEQIRIISGPQIKVKHLSPPHDDKYALINFDPKLPIILRLNKDGDLLKAPDYQNSCTSGQLLALGLSQSSPTQQLEVSENNSMAFTAPASDTQIGLGEYYTLAVDVGKQPEQYKAEFYLKNQRLGPAKVKGGLLTYEVNTSLLGLGKYQFTLILSDTNDPSKSTKLESPTLEIINDKLKQPISSGGGGGGGSGSSSGDSSSGSVTNNPNSILPDKPVCLNCPTEAFVGIPNKIQIKSSHGGNRLVKYSVDWGDASPVVESDFINSGELISLFHTYLSPGEQLIKIHVIDDLGKSGNQTLEQQVYVIEKPRNNLELVIQ